MADLEVTMEEWMQLCYTRPDVFAHYYFDHIIRSPSSRFHFLLYDLIHRISDSSYANYVAVGAPRGNAKTQIIHVILPIWCIAFERKEYIVMVSDTSRAVESNLESIKYELTTNEKLAEHFPHIVGEGRRWKREEIDTNNNVRITALGSGKQFRGTQKKGGVRPDLVLCHPKGTKILTTVGYKDVSKLVVGDTVYNHKWEKDKLIAWRKYEWEGDYYSLQLNGCITPIEATAGHKFFVRKKGPKLYERTTDYMNCLDRGKFKRRKYKQFNTTLPMSKINIREIKKGDYIGYAINNKVLSIEEIVKLEGWAINSSGGIKKRNSKGQITEVNRPIKILVDPNKVKWLKSKEFWYLCGVFLGDGSVDCKNKHRTVYYCNPAEPEKIKKIKQCIVACGSTPWEVQVNNCVRIYFNNSLASYIFSTWKKDKNSHKVPSINIEFLDPELQKELIKGYIAADGWVSNEQDIRITSGCLPLLEFTQRILLRQNIIATIRKGIKGRKSDVAGKLCNTQDKYDLYFNQGASILGYSIPERPKQRTAFIEDGWVWRQVKSNNCVFKKDIVYPFTVKNEHTYINSYFSSMNCDDVLNDEHVNTKAQRDKLEEWFVKVILGMAGVEDRNTNSNMSVILSGTILHPKDLLSKLLSKSEYLGWEKHKFKSVYQDSKSPLWQQWKELYTSYKDDKRKETARQFFIEHEAEMMEGVEVLWPEGDPYYKLQEYKINAGLKAYCSEKMLDPIDPSTVLFDHEKFVYFDRSDIELDDLVIYGAIDPASGDAKKKGDLTAIITIGKNPKTGIMYVLDVKADNTLSPSDSIKYIKRMHELYEYRYFGIDSDALKLYKDLILREIPSLMGKLKLYNLRVNKRSRIDRLEPPINSGLIQIQKTQYELLEELLHFPKSEYDDVLDALEIVSTVAGNRKCKILTY